MKMAIGRLEVDVTSTGRDHEVALAGQLDERADLTSLLGRLTGGRVVFDLSLVSFINSIGVREWIRLLAGLRDRKCEVVLRRCSEAMVHQMNMIAETSRGAIVESFFMPVDCPSCGYEASIVVEVAPHRTMLARKEAPSVACPECSAPARLNELPERYLLFLSHDAASGT